MQGTSGGSRCRDVGYGDLRKSTPVAASARAQVLAHRRHSFRPVRGRRHWPGLQRPGKQRRRYVGGDFAAAAGPMSWQAPSVASPRPAAFGASICACPGNGNTPHLDDGFGRIGRAGGRCLGMEPRAKTSLTIMRSPEHGHGRGRTRQPSGEVLSGRLACPCPPSPELCAGAWASRRCSRLRLPLARSP